MQSIPPLMPTFEDVAGAALNTYALGQKSRCCGARHYCISTDTVFDFEKQHISLCMEAVLMHYLR